MQVIMMIMNLFCGMVEWGKSVKHYLQLGVLPETITIENLVTLQAGFKYNQSKSCKFVEW